MMEVWILVWVAQQKGSTSAAAEEDKGVRDRRGTRHDAAEAGNMCAGLLMCDGAGGLLAWVG
jgi:hypothetical protein